MTVSVAEGFNFCLPDALPVIYHCSYVMPFLVVVFIRVVQVCIHTYIHTNIMHICIHTVHMSFA